MGDGLLEMNCCLKFNRIDLQGEIPYKYCVYTPKTINAGYRDAQFEFIYSTLDGASGDFVNHVLHLPFGYHPPQSIEQPYLYKILFLFILQEYIISMI